MERQTSFELRAKRRMTYAFPVGNQLSWEDVFNENSVRNWPRRVRELHSSGAFLSLSDLNSGEIRLDWLVHMGGPLREVFDQYCDARGQIPSGLELQISMAPDPVLIFEIQAWLKAHAVKGRQFRLSANGAWRTHLVDLNIPVKFEARSMSDRANECTARFLNLLWRDLALAPDLRVELLNASLKQVTEFAASEPPWTACRRLGTWLKFRNDRLRFSAADIFEIEKRVSLVLAFLSPQDEEQEAKSLEARDLMLNPTLEVLVRPAALGNKSNPLLVVGRYRDSMFEHDLNIVEAALLEFVRESFRAQEATVCSSVAVELERNLSRGQQEVYQNLQRLKFEGLILSSDSQQNV